MGTRKSWRAEFETDLGSRVRATEEAWWQKEEASWPRPDSVFHAAHGVIAPALGSLLCSRDSTGHHCDQPFYVNWDVYFKQKSSACLKASLLLSTAACAEKAPLRVIRV